MIRCTVSGNDIKVGKRKSVGYCPVSYCLKRVFGRNDIQVSPDYAFVGPHMIELPPHVGQFVQAFDKKLSVRSIDFELPEPPENLTFKSDS